MLSYRSFVTQEMAAAGSEAFASSQVIANHASDIYCSHPGCHYCATWTPVKLLTWADERDTPLTKSSVQSAIPKKSETLAPLHVKQLGIVHTSG